MVTSKAKSCQWLNYRVKSLDESQICHNSYTRYANVTAQINLLTLILCRQASPFSTPQSFNNFFIMHFINKNCLILSKFKGSSSEMIKFLVYIISGPNCKYCHLLIHFDWSQRAMRSEPVFFSWSLQSTFLKICYLFIFDMIFYYR